MCPLRNEIQFGSETADKTKVVVPGDISLPAGFVSELARADSEQAVLVATARWMPDIIAADRSTVAIPEDPNRLRIFELDGEALVPETTVPLYGSVTGAAFRSQQVRLISSLDDISAPDLERVRALGFRSALISPLVSGGRSYGTINVASRNEAGFGRSDEQLLRALGDLIASFVATHQLAIAERKRARTDHLTGCLNRRAILNRLDKRFDRKDSPPSLIYVDLCGFKAINDRHGHQTGDEVLKVTASRLQSVLRPSDRCGRLGGDEFLIVVDDDPDGTIAYELAKQAIQAGRHPIVASSVHLNPLVNIGIANVVPGTDHSSDLLADADQAMYTAKETGQTIVVADRSTRAHTATVARVDADLDLGMSKSQITYHFQPIRCVQTMEVLGAEALIRWDHPALGPIPAPLLVERLAATGRTDAFTRWSLRNVIESWAQVRAELPHFHDKAASINMSPQQLAWPEYVDFHLATLAKYGFRPQDIVVEVVESGMIEPGDAAEATLKRLGAADVVIALDDFGTGHNGLRYFTMFPIHAIKFDRTLVDSMTKQETARKVLKGLATLATDLEISSVAEGIETDAKLALCRRINIPEGQGWHLGLPKPADAFIAERLAEMHVGVTSAAS